MKHSLLRIIVVVAAMVTVGALLIPRVGAQRTPAGWTADHIEPIGYSDLDGRAGGFKMAIREVDNRWYLYMGHIWHQGWSIVDVTDPTNPKHLKFIR